MTVLRWVRIALWGLVFAVAGFLLLGTLLIDRWRPPEPSPVASPATAVGGSFSLVDHTGRRVSERDFLGRPLAVFFGFTHCPDVCPTTLSWLTALADSLGPQADPLRILFITVDPERDSPEVMAGYVESFGPKVVGLTGTPEDVATTIATWKVYAQKVPLEDGGYTMDHTASVLLVDRNGRFRNTLDSHDQTKGVNAAKLLRLLRDE